MSNTGARFVGPAGAARPTACCCRPAPRDRDGLRRAHRAGCSGRSARPASRATRPSCATSPGAPTTAATTPPARGASSPRSSPPATARRALRRIAVPTVVIHGTADRLVRALRRPRHGQGDPGRAPASSIEGMGHDLPRGAWPQISTRSPRTPRARAPTAGPATGSPRPSRWSSATRSPSSPAARRASAARWRSASPTRAPRASSSPTSTATAPRRSPPSSAGAALGVGCDVADATPGRRARRRAPRSAFGPVDLFCANAGVGAGSDPMRPTPTGTSRFGVNVRAHVLAARRLLPGWLERGEGYFLSDGLGRRAADPDRLGALRGHQARGRRLRRVAGDHLRRPRRPGRAACARWASTRRCCTPASRRAASRRGRRVVAGRRARSSSPRRSPTSSSRGCARSASCILPHPEVLEFCRRKADDYDRWLAGMRRLQAHVGA